MAEPIVVTFPATEHNPAYDVSLICAECDSTWFYRWEGGNYSERHSLDLDPAWQPTGSGYSDREDWDKREDDMMNSEPWKCANDHVCGDDLSDAIEQWRYL